MQKTESPDKISIRFDFIVSIGLYAFVCFMFFMLGYDVYILPQTALSDFIFILTMFMLSFVFWVGMWMMVQTSIERGTDAREKELQQQKEEYYDKTIEYSHMIDRIKEQRNISGVHER